MYVCTYKKLLRDFKLGFAATICTYIYVCIYVHMYVSILVTKSKSMSAGLQLLENMLLFAPRTLPSSGRRKTKSGSTSAMMVSALISPQPHAACCKSGLLQVLIGMMDMNTVAGCDYGVHNYTVFRLHGMLQQHTASGSCIFHRLSQLLFVFSSLLKSGVTRSLTRRGS